MLKSIKYFNLSLILFIFSCRGDDDNIFTGITETDEFAIIIGSVDESDWQTDEFWTEEEIRLFPELINLDYNNSNVETSNSGGSWIGYPNPSTSNISVITFTLFGDLEFGHIVLVDNDINVLFNWEFDEDFTIEFNFSEFSSNELLRNKKGIFRAYYVYKLIDDEFIFKGHGDLLIQ